MPNRSTSTAKKKAADTEKLPSTKAQWDRFARYWEVTDRYLGRLRRSLRPPEKLEGLDSQVVEEAYERAALKAARTFDMERCVAKGWVGTDWELERKWLAVVRKSQIRKARLKAAKLEDRETLFSRDAKWHHSSSRRGTQPLHDEDRAPRLDDRLETALECLSDKEKRFMWKSVEPEGDRRSAAEAVGWDPDSGEDRFRQLRDLLGSAAPDDASY